MTPMLPGPAAQAARSDLVAASLLTSGGSAELHLITRDGQRLRIAADEVTARRLALGLWQVIEQAA